jgi:hypothetical protein
MVDVYKTYAIVFTRCSAALVGAVESDDDMT